MGGRHSNIEVPLLILHSQIATADMGKQNANTGKFTAGGLGWC